MSAVSPDPGDRAAVLDLYRRHVSAGQARLARLMDLPLECRSEGCLVYDEHDRPYLDCGGYGVFLMGHRHPEVVRAVRDQLDRHPLTTRVMLNGQLAAAAAELAAVAPDGLDFVAFTNSGAEAVEVAIKLARLHGKRRLIATHGGFHGKTMGALSVTGRRVYQDPFLPLLPDVEFVPFGDPVALEAALGGTAGEACVILEPVQAEGGVRIPPDGYLRAVREVTSRHGALLVLDEIQCGLGRLGAWWGADREGIVPDVLLAGKALGGGVVPVGALLATPEVFAPLSADPFLHSSTFAGNPLVMAAVRAAVRVIAGEDLPAKACRLGGRLLTELRQRLLAACPELVVEVRGVGLLLGIEMASPAAAAELMLGLLRRQVVVCHSLNAQEVVRLTPPAGLTAAQCEWLYAAVSEAAAALTSRKRAHTQEEDRR
ncbi:MAG TPA: aminotransferase class III-fold pyridoxal phosphate-dependent enzyme [Thermoanaerobaculia bacterium]|nr:aminotransferase class III-fold pyridoxal phosphate-dependent enzyme [Thermoanaerobaculia bacterium]